MSAAPDALRLRSALERAVLRRRAPAVLLSGGPDGSIVAALARRAGPLTGFVVAARGVPCPDLVHARRVAARLDIPLVTVRVGPGELRRHAARAVAAARSFRPCAVRLAAALWPVFRRIRELGFDAVMTGDGADELFLGYRPLLSMTPAGLAAYRRDPRPLAFEENPLARACGLELRLPYLEPEVVRLARRAPLRRLVGVRGGRRVGKWLLREAFQGLLPSSVLWRGKVPFGRGSGLDALPAPFARPPGAGPDGLRFADPEAAHYYALYRRRFGALLKRPLGGRENL